LRGPKRCLLQVNWQPDYRFSKVVVKHLAPYPVRPAASPEVTVVAISGTLQHSLSTNMVIQYIKMLNVALIEGYVEHRERWWTNWAR
jgi:hypothetical protein